MTLADELNSQGVGDRQIYLLTRGGWQFVDMSLFELVHDADHSEIHILPPLFSRVILRKGRFQGLGRNLASNPKPPPRSSSL